MRRGAKILLHCDDRRRDAVTIAVLADSLRWLGHEVLVCNRVTLHQYDRVFDPEILVLSHVFMYGDAAQLGRKAARARIVVLPTEGAILSRGSGVTSSSGQPLHASREERQALTRHVTTICVWGEASRRFVIEEGVYRAEQVVVVGCPRFDCYRSALFEEARRPASPRIGVVGDFGPINVYDQRNHLEQICQTRGEHGIYYDADKNLEDRFWLQYAEFRLVLELMEQATLRHRLSVAYRPHPYEYIKNYEFLQRRLGSAFILEEGRTPFFLWLAQLSALVVTSSTAVVEAFLTGIPVVTLQPMLGEALDRHMTLPDYRHPLLRYCWTPRSIDEGIALLEASIAGKLKATDVTTPEVRAFLREYYDWPRQEPSVITIARHIDRIAREGLHGRPAGNGLMADRLRREVALPLLNLLLFCRYRVQRRHPVHQHSHFYPWHRSDLSIARRVARELGEVGCR